MSNQPQVTYEDQQRFNKFGRIHAETTDLQLRIDDLEKEIEQIQDAIGEVENLLDDDGCVRVKIGEIYFDVNNDNGVELLNKIIEQKEAKIAEAKAQKDEIDTEIDTLREQLRTKFGDSVSLG